MAEVIRMPRMSDTMEEGNIIGWLKEEGETVEAGDTLAEVETDKATMELDSFSDGVLLHIAVKEGPVAINGVIAVIGEAGEDWKAAIAAAEASNGQATEAEAEAPKEEVSSAATSTESVATTGSSGDDRVKASPLAKSMAKESGIDLAQVTGTGDNGRIVKRDIQAFISTQSAQPAPSAPAPAAQPQPLAPPAAPPKVEKEAPSIPAFSFSAGADNFEEVPVSNMRKVIARRLGESKFSAPHFYLTVELDMEKVSAMRKRVNEVAPTRISFNDFVIKAAAIALRQHPQVNSSWLGDKIRVNKNISVGVAVAVDEGLLVPVIRYADMKTLSQINVEVKELAGKARNRKLHPDEMQGNTFTISNLGMFGIEEFTAIINPPDSCIMAVGTIAEKPVVKNGEITIGKRMKVTLSCDHRVVDGATGAQFLQTFKEIIEDPIRIMV